MRQQRLIWTSVILTAAVISTAGFLNEKRVAAQAGQDRSPAPAIDPALFSGLHWRSIGPNRGGRSQAVAGSDSRPFEYYFGATGGGLWKTTDGGQTWHAGLGQVLQDLVRRRRGRGAVEPRRRLRRHGRDRAPRQHHARRRRLQIH